MAPALAPEEPSILQLFHLVGQAAVTGCTNTIVDLSDTYELDYGFLGGKNRVFHCASGIIQGVLFPAPQVGSARVNITTVTHRTRGWMGQAIKQRNLLK